MKCWPNMHLCEKVGLLSTGEFLSITKQKKKKIVERSIQNP